MKYGETLRQRSIPQWGPYNIDYDEIKHLIKEHTTPGNAKAVAIPGQAHLHEREFEEQLLAVLVEEHRRIDLFVRSKSGEIERRLNHTTKQINAFTLRERASPHDRRISEKRRQKYGRIEGDVLKAGEEIRSLARFVGAQQLAFAKLLKKYKKWTGSDALEGRFKDEVLNQPGSFSRTDLAPLLNYWTDALQTVRAAYQAGDAAQPARTAVGDGNLSGIAGSENLAAIPPKIQAVAESGSEVDLDVALATLPLGQAGSRATYWIHPDQVVEIQVLLLQTLRLFDGMTRLSTPDSPLETPKRRDSSERLDTMTDNERADDIGVIFIGDPERYAQQRSATTVEETEETPGKPAVRALGSARWNSNGEAALVIAPDVGVAHGSPLACAKLKRKHLGTFLELDRPFHSRRSSGLSPISEHDMQADVSERNPVDEIRAWMLSHRDFRPMAAICAKRSRFVGLDNDSEHGIWATLDRDICMKTSLHTQLAEKDWMTKGRSDAVAFPHAVLSVRCEGAHANDLIQVLDKSHLTERIRGFSLEAHAIWTCCKPAAMQPPYWLSMIERDIRKVPEPAPRQPSRRSSTALLLDHGNSRQTSVSNSSATDGQTSRYTTQHGDSSATSINEIEAFPQTAAKKPRPSKLRELAAIQPASGSGTSQRYWNEYDHPEDGEDEDAYVIYVDPYDSLKIPGQETLTKLFGRIKTAFGGRRSSVQESLLSTASFSGEDSDDNEPSSTVHTRNYGTLQSSQPNRLNALLGIFRPTNQDRGLLPQHRHPVATIGAQPSDLSNLLATLEHRRSEREATKRRLCVTSLAASVVVLAITWMLAATSRRKLRREVDAVVVVGLVADLVFAVVGVLYAVSKRKGLGLLEGLLVAAVVTGVCLADGGLLVWLLN